MAITRRQFIKRTGLATAGTLLGPSLFSNPFVRQAMADTIGHRYLVVLFLDGGNDGLNTVIPYQSGSLRTSYDLNRRTDSGGINVTQGQLDGSAIGTSGTLIGNDPGSGLRLALHPGFASLKQLYDLGKVAVIQGCGYPDYNLSHDQSRTIWETANPLGLSAYTGTGWVGRHLAAEYGGTDIPGVCIEDEVAPEFRQTATSVLAINRLRDFGFPYDDDHSDDQPAKRATFQDLYDNAVADAQPLRNYLGNSGSATLLASESYPQAHSRYQHDRPAASQTYDDVGRSTATDLREIAKVIYAVEQSLPNVSAHFFRLSNGGYDTHSDQGGYDPANGQQHSLHAEVGDSLLAFYNDRDHEPSRRPEPGRESRLCRGVERVLAPRPAERQRHRPRLAGPDVRLRRLRRRRCLRAPSRHRQPRRQREHRVLAGRRSPSLHGLPRRLRHHPEAPRQHGAGGHPGERAAGRRRQSHGFLDDGELRPRVPALGRRRAAAVAA